MYKSQHIITLRHYLILFVIAFAAGIYAAVVLSTSLLFPLLLILGALFTVLSVLLCVLLLINRKGKPIKPILLPILIIFCFFLGTVRLAISEVIFDDELSTYKDKSVWVSGIVSSAPTETSNSFSYSMELLVCKVNDEPTRPETIILYVPKSRGEHLREGDKICCWTTLSTPDRNDDFSNYDYFSHLRGKNIFLVGTTQNINPDSFEPVKNFEYYIKSLGRFVKDKVIFAADSLLYDSPKLATILKGILVGDKSGFSDNLYKKFSYAGLSHIVAVSGMHLSILFSLLAFLLLKLPLSWKNSLLISIPFLILFASAANFTPSVCRAALMMLVMIAAAFLNQRYLPINALFISLAIILCATPYALFSKSLSLSFGATFGILVYWGYLMKLFPIKIHMPESISPKISWCLLGVLKFIATSLATSISAFLGTAYFSALFFENVSWIQFLTNLWVIPAVTAAFSLGFAASILFYISPYLATSVFYYPLRFFLGIIYKTADIFGKREFSIFIPESSLTGAAFILYTGALIFIYFLLKNLCDMKKEKSDRKGVIT